MACVCVLLVVEQGGIDAFFQVELGGMPPLSTQIVTIQTKDEASRVLQRRGGKAPCMQLPAIKPLTD